MNQNDKFVVLGDKNGLGLLVGNYVLKPGTVFLRGDWKWGDDVLNAAIKDDRCKEIVEPKEEVEVAKAEKPKEKVAQLKQESVNQGGDK
jgi:hypothetical protein